jgi:hypothetical protein
VAGKYHSSQVAEEEEARLTHPNRTTRNKSVLINEKERDGQTDGRVMHPVKHAWRRSKKERMMERMHEN